MTDDEAILNALRGGKSTIAEIIRMTGAGAQTIIKALKRLRDAKLIEASPDGSWRPIPEPKTPKPPKQDPAMLATVTRLERHLSAVRERYPDAWKQVDLFRSPEMRRKLGDWPEWCYLPLSGACAIVTGGDDSLLPAMSPEISVLGAMAAWRVTKGIYQFDGTVLDELWATPVTGDIPVDVLERLPEWCCYVPFDPPRPVARMQCRGFFVHLEYDATTHRRELRFVLDDADDMLIGFPIHLVGNLSDCVAAMVSEAQRQYRQYGGQGHLAEDVALVTIEETAQMMREFAPLVSLTLYLCSTNAEILGRDGKLKPMGRPHLTHTRRGGARIFAVSQPMVWEVAYRLGSVLRAAGPGWSGPERGGTHASPRPHLRRAHWHAFWTGTKAAVGVARETDRKLVLKWLPPIPVNAGSGDVIPAVHRVAWPRAGDAE